jgi:hypothetical protein
MFVALKEVLGYHRFRGWLGGGNICDTIVDNAGHRLLSTGNKKLIAQYYKCLICGRDHVENSRMEVQVNLNCSC